MDSNIEELVYTLADHLKMNIAIGSNNKLLGTSEIVLKVLGLELPTIVKIVDSLVSVEQNQVGVLLKIRGNLYLYVHSNASEGTVNWITVDGSKLQFSMKEQGKYLPRVITYTGVRMALAKGIAEEYTKKGNNPNWTKLA